MLTGRPQWRHVVCKIATRHDGRKTTPGGRHAVSPFSWHADGKTALRHAGCSSAARHGGRKTTWSGWQAVRPRSWQAYCKSAVRHVVCKSVVRHGGRMTTLGDRHVARQAGSNTASQHCVCKPAVRRDNRKSTLSGRHAPGPPSWHANCEMGMPPEGAAHAEVHLCTRYWRPASGHHRPFLAYIDVNRLVDDMVLQAHVDESDEDLVA